MYWVCPGHEELVQIVGDACRVRRVAIPPGLLNRNRKKTESKAACLSSENPLGSILCFSIVFNSYCSSSSGDRLVEFLVNSLTIGRGARRCGGE
jgi:hypothetical protein